MIGALADMEQMVRAFLETSVQGKILVKAYRPFWATAKGARILGFDRVEVLSQRLSALAIIDAESRANPVLAEAAICGLTQGQARAARRALRSAQLLLRGQSAGTIKTR